MIGLSVWIFRDPNKLSLIDEHVIKIIEHNQKFFSKYYIVTNNKEHFEKISKNLVFIEEDTLLRILITFGIKKMPRDHQLSDIGTLWADQLINSFDLSRNENSEPILYVDADFILTNYILLKDLETHVNEYSLFYDKGFYCTNGMGDRYINAALAFFPLNIYNKDNVLNSMKTEQVRRLNSGGDTEYNDVGPRLINKFKDKLVIQENIEPCTPPFGTFIPDGSTQFIELKYNPKSLGIHMLFSLFKVCKVKVTSLEIHGYCIKLRFVDDND